MSVKLISFGWFSREAPPSETVQYAMRPASVACVIVRPKPARIARVGIATSTVATVQTKATRAPTSSVGPSHRETGHLQAQLFVNVADVNGQAVVGGGGHFVGLRQLINPRGDDSIWASWIYVARTTGRRRMDRDHKKHGQSIRDIYLYPLIGDARQYLCGGPIR